MTLSLCLLCAFEGELGERIRGIFSGGGKGGLGSDLSL